MLISFSIFCKLNEQENLALLKLKKREFRTETCPFLCARCFTTTASSTFPSTVCMHKCSQIPALCYTTLRWYTIRNSNVSGVVTLAIGSTNLYSVSRCFTGIRARTTIPCAITIDPAFNPGNICALYWTFWTVCQGDVVHMSCPSPVGKCDVFDFSNPRWELTTTITKKS